MVFEHTDHYFENTVIELQDVGSFPNLEAWSAEDENSKVVFIEGKFAHGFVGGSGVTVNTATCQKT
jgi:dTDP-4-dehydrorhamnose 3,5-epimerase-like enzyme